MYVCVCVSINLSISQSLSSRTIKYSKKHQDLIECVLWEEMSIAFPMFRYKAALCDRIVTLVLFLVFSISPYSSSCHVENRDALPISLDSFSSEVSVTLSSSECHNSIDFQTKRLGEDVRYNILSTLQEAMTFILLAPQFDILLEECVGSAEAKMNKCAVFEQAGLVEWASVGRRKEERTEDDDLINERDHLNEKGGVVQEKTRTDDRGCGEWNITPTGAAAISMRSWLLFQPALIRNVRQGGAFYENLGDAEKETRSLFVTAMEEFTRAQLDSVLQQKDAFKECTTVCDIGGGSGLLLESIGRHFDVHTILFEQSEDAIERSTERELERVVYCDMFGEEGMDALRECDCVVLKGVITDLTETQIYSLLHNLRNHIHKSMATTLLLFDHFLFDDEPSNHFTRQMGVMMRLLFNAGGGRVGDVRRAAAACGWEVVEEKRTSTPLSFITLRPAALPQNVNNR